MKKQLAAVLVIVMLLTMGACSQQQAPAAPQAPVASTAPEGTPAEVKEEVKPVKLALVVQTLENMFFLQLAEAAEAHVAKLENVELTIVQGKTPEEQLKVMEDLIATNPDVIAVTPIDKAAIVPPIEAAMEKGIPVFCLDNDNDLTEITSYIGTDNVLGGYLAGEWIIKTLGGEGKMAILEGPAGNYNSNIRRQGMDDAFAAIDNNIEIVASVTANWRRDQGLNVANDIITANPDLDLIFSLNDEMAFGALEAIAASGRDIILIGFNGVPEAFLNIYNGNMAATVGQYPEMMATSYIDIAVELVRNGTAPERVNKIPAAVVDTEMIKDVVDNNKAANTLEEELLYAKLRKYYQG